MKKVDRNFGKIRPNKINDLKKTALFFGAFSNKYLAFKTMAPMRFLGFRRQMQVTPQIQLVCGLRGFQQLGVVMANDHCM